MADRVCMEDSQLSFDRIDWTTLNGWCRFRNFHILLSPSCAANSTAITLGLGSSFDL